MSPVHESDWLPNRCVCRHSRVVHHDYPGYSRGVRLGGCGICGPDCLEFKAAVDRPPGQPRFHIEEEQVEPVPGVGPQTTGYWVATPTAVVAYVGDKAWAEYLRDLLNQRRDTPPL